MNHKRIKVTALVVLFLIAGLLYSADRNQDIFLKSYQKNVAETEMGIVESAENTAEAAGTQLSNQEDTIVDSMITRSDVSDGVVSQQAAGQETEQIEGICVHVCGAVKTAGVYRLPETAIVKDALEAAGGVSEGGAADYLNLAKHVSDGEKIYVPFLKDLEDPYGVSKSGLEDLEAADGYENDRVNINTADKAQLMTLTGIGEARAEAIIAYRASHGKFQKAEDIMNVSGIKEGAFEKIKDQITV